jgi:phosphatidylserine/phosphatidylglycerophosphate/cardiolipin synthase-like enzyme
MMLLKEPRYWGSWKGRVVKAISIDGAKTWKEIRDQTGLSPKSLQKVLAELFQSESLEKTGEGQDATYRVAYELYKSYRDFFETEHEIKDTSDVRITEAEQKDLVGWIDQWKDAMSLDISLLPKHFFLQGSKLTNFSEQLIMKAKKQVIVVNPFVDQCDLSDSLWKTANDDKEVILITQPPEKEKDERSRARKEKQHQALKDKGVRIIHNDRVHAKLIVVDKAAAIASSMNLTSLSIGGSSWEAGLVTIEDTVVESIIDSILRLIERPDSEET